MKPTDENDRPASHHGDLWVTLLNLAVGTWLLLSPYLFTGSLADGEDDVAVGVGLLLLAGYGGVRLTRGDSLPKSALLASFGGGMWLLAFSVDYGHGAPLTYDGVVAGAALALASTYLYRRHFHPFERD